MVDRLRTYKEKLESRPGQPHQPEGDLFAPGTVFRRAYGAPIGPCESGVGVENLGLMGDPHHPWGITVIEGGAEMEINPRQPCSLCWPVFCIQTRVARRREMLDGKHFPPMQILFEEANKC